MSGKEDEYDYLFKGNAVPFELVIRIDRGEPGHKELF